MTGISCKASFAAAMLLLSPALESSAREVNVLVLQGEVVKKVAPGFYYLHGRGELRVPPGWKLVNQVGNRLVDVAIWSFAAAATASAVNPNLCKRSLRGAEAPKDCIPIRAPVGPM